MLVDFQTVLTTVDFFDKYLNTVYLIQLTVDISGSIPDKLMDGEWKTVSA